MPSLSMKLTRRLAMAALAASTALTALPAGPALADQSNDTLVAAFRAQLPSLDRYHAPGREGFLLGLLAYDTLVYRNTETFELEPLIAKEWSQIDDLTYEFKLRDDVTFHNGDPLTAEDVAYTFLYAANPENNVFNRTTPGWIDDVQVVDDYTVRVIAKEVTPLAMQYIVQLPILPKAYREKVGLQEFAEHPVGSGPYMIEGKDGNDIVFKAFDGYMKDGPKNVPEIGTLIYRAIPDVNTQVAELISGGIDWAWYIPDDQAQKLAQMPNLEVINAPTFRVAFLTMDAAGLTDAEGPLTDVRVRKAIAHAIDREAIAKSLIGGSSETIPSACNPAQYGCEQDVTEYDYDPEAARALMAEAGYADGFDIDIYGYRSRPVAEAILGYLSEIGIRGNLVWQQYSAVIQSRRDHQTPLVIDDFGSAGVADTGAITTFFFGESPDDQSRDPVVTEAIQEAGRIADQDRRAELFSTALKQIADKAYWAPLFTVPINYVMSSDVDVPVPDDENVEFWRATWK
ncbi:ABC transporter substrate-binding protein [Salipiger sp. PrR002]|uniref:ABC transporter substrate-binding protein n=1 Tax=Salipiger sp. PrR002 TaxID=2706489 RepID=UPI0013BB1D7E|nr:ABC transporter substrate-binding protein [Salipiger sp. PrR002]NDW01759.1 ABC transporter substrate-binding protein [Salipiger sp. PrR002]NDW57804.1 ABC transporter substrate-binding protein [Salipiger sp. PrR004]